MTATIDVAAASAPTFRLFTAMGDTEETAEPEGRGVAVVASRRSGVAGRLSERDRERLAKLGPLAAAVLVTVVLGGVAAAERWVSRSSARPPQPRRPALVFTPRTGLVAAPTTPVPSGTVPAEGRVTSPVQLIVLAPGESPQGGGMPEFGGADDPATFSGYERNLAEEVLKARLGIGGHADPEPTPPPAEDVSSRLVSATKTFIRTVSDVTGGPPR